MTANTQYGTVGALALIVGGVLSAAAIVMQDVGTNPNPLTQGAGLLSLVLFAVGIVALVAMMFDVYSDDDY